MNSSVVSKWLFGRLSFFCGDKMEAIDSIESAIYNSTDKDLLYSGGLKNFNLNLKKNEIYLVGVKSALTDLNGLIEAIILSDKLINYSSWNQQYLNKINQAYFTGPISWYKMMGNAAAANDIMQSLRSSMEFEAGILEDGKIIDVLTFSKLMTDSLSDNLCTLAISEKEVNHEQLTSLYQIFDDPMSEYKLLSDESKRTIEQCLQSILGCDWTTYRNDIIIKELWPVEMLYANHHEIWTNELDRDLALYSEFKLALESASFAASGLTSGRYFKEMSEMTSNFQIGQIVSKRYQEKIKKEFDAFGISTVNLSIPPLLRMSMLNANSILDVINNSLKLREKKWAKDLRKYLTELQHNESLTSTIKNLKRLDVHIEKTLSEIGTSIASGVGLSSTGSVSLSIPTIHERILRWRNPAMIMYTKMDNAIGNNDSINDVSRIFQVSKLEANELIKKMKFN